MATSQSGYYYDPQIDRYFRISSNSTGQIHPRAKKPKHVEPGEETKEKQDHGNYENNFVTFLRERTTRLGGIETSQSLLKDWTLIQLKPLDQVINSCQQGYIKELKIDASGEMMAVYDVLYQDVDGLMSAHSNINFYRFSRKTDDIILEQSFPLFGMLSSDQRCHHWLSDFYYSNDVYHMLVQPLIHYRSSVLVKLYNKDSQWSVTHSMISMQRYDYEQVSSFTWETQGQALYGLRSGRVLKTSIEYASTKFIKLASCRTAVNDIAPLTESTFVGGCGNGCVYIYDDRCSSTVMKIGLPALPVVRLHPLSNATQLVISAMNSQLGLWDLRAANTVLHSFHEHVNSHSFTYSFIDSEETFLAAVSDGNKVLFWSLNSGNLIHQLSLNPEGTRPVIGYTHHLCGAGGPPVFFVAMDTALTLYTLRDRFKLSNSSFM